MQERRVHQIFAVSVSLKGLHALLEIAGGIALYGFSADAIARWLDEIDRGGLVARYFDLSEQNFYAFYLLSHGLVKVVLVYGPSEGEAVGIPRELCRVGAFHRLPALPLQLHA